MSVTTTVGIDPVYMTISDTGQINYPIQSSFLAYLPSTVVNATGSGAGWILGSGTPLSIIYDQRGTMSTSGIFTAPVTGKYVFNACVKVGNILLTMQKAIASIITESYTFEGGEANVAALISLSGRYSINLSVVCPMQANETAKLRIALSGGLGNTASIIGGSTPMVSWFSGSLVA